MDVLPLPASLRHRRALTVTILSLGLGVAGGLLGALGVGTIGGAFDRLSYAYDGYGPERSPFNLDCALAGLISTALLCALVPTLVFRNPETTDVAGVVMKTCAKLGLVNTPLTLCLLFAGSSVDGRDFQSVGHAVQTLCTFAVIVAAISLVGSVIAAPLGLAFGVVFTPVIASVRELGKGRDAAAPELAARWIAGLLLPVAGLVELAAVGPFARFGVAAALLVALGAAIGSLVLRALRLSFSRALERHPTLTLVPLRDAELPVDVLHLEAHCDRAVVRRDDRGPYRGPRGALALVG